MDELEQMLELFPEADEDFFCEYCKQYGYSCRDCIVTEWKEEIRE